MRILKTAAALTIVAILMLGLGRPWGSLPPLGHFFNPFTGFWQNHAGRPLPAELILPGLRDAVTVAVDGRGVPHIRAENSHDLYFAQGYVTARDRLWQMDMQTRYTAGRLAEVMGPSMVESDRFQRRLGLTAAAETALKAFERDPETREVVEAYTAGVNAYIASLTPRSLPLEYRLMRFRPEPWTALRCALLLKSMAWDLTSYNRDLQNTRTRDFLDVKTYNRLFPERLPFEEPVVSGYGDNGRTRGRTIPADALLPGSNNWVVAGSRTASGYPILCNDPHLGLQLPSLWYEIHLTAPDMDVAGVSFPGAPAVIIGFNRHTAWGVTNAGTDVFDWVQITRADSAGPIHGARPRREVIRVKGGKTVIDTVWWTDFGPVPRRAGEPYGRSWIPADAAMRWTGHDESNELRTFIMLNRARSLGEFEEALKTYVCPAQNFVFACRARDIAIRHQGKFPLRRPGTGPYVLTEMEAEASWRRFIPFEDVPHEINPDRGFLASANQEPAGPGYPYPMPGNYSGLGRARRINDLLSVAGDVTPEEMMAMQLDTYSVFAAKLLPALLPRLDPSRLDESARQTLNLLLEWDFMVRAESAAPVVMDAWWQELYRLIWEEPFGVSEASLRWPAYDVTLKLILNHPDSRYFDDRRTEERKTLDLLIRRSFQAVHDSLTAKLGLPGENWHLGSVRGTDIHHLARLPALGVLGLQTGGGRGIVNATSKTFGPSWRMVVSLEEEVKAWGVYPGGQSGNPGSPLYDSMVEDWRLGVMHPLNFYRSTEEALSDGATITRMRGRK